MVFFCSLPRAAGETSGRWHSKWQVIFADFSQSCHAGLESMVISISTKGWYVDTYNHHEKKTMLTKTTLTDIYPDFQVSSDQMSLIGCFIWMFPKIVVPRKSSILMGFSIINHPFWGTPIFGNTHIGDAILPSDNYGIISKIHDEASKILEAEPEPLRISWFHGACHVRDVGWPLLDFGGPKDHHQW